VVKDRRKLSFEYVPEKLVHRELQMRSLETLFYPMVSDGVSCSAFLTGSVGAGKTVTARRFCEDMLRHCAGIGKTMDVIFINCRIRNTEHGVILHTLRHFDPGFPDRGFSADEMLRFLKKHMESGHRPALLVLDEADVLLKGGSRDLVYQLSRLTGEMQGRASLSVMMISQEHVMEMLDKASISSFKKANTVRFERYTKSELKDIIVARAEEALLTDAMDDETADLLADIGRGQGDARLVIELLDKAATIAEERADGRLTADDVRTANAYIYASVSEDKLASLDKKKMLALLAIARAIKGDPYVSITRAERTYAVVCEEYGETARKHTQFWKYIQDMENMSLLDTMVRNEDEGGRVTYISIPDITPKELARKLEHMLDTPTSSDDLEL